MLSSIRSEYADAYRGLPRDVWLLSVAALINRAGTMVIPFLALYMTKHLGFAKEDAGLLIGVYGGGSLIGTWVGGYLTDRIGALRIQVTSLWLTAATIFLLGQVERPLNIAIVLFSIGVVAEAFRPASGAFLASIAPAESRMRAYALMRLAVNTGMTFGPAVGGFLILIDYSLLFWVDASACITAALVIWFFFRRHDSNDTRESPSKASIQSPWTDRPYLQFLLSIFMFSLMFFQLQSAFGVYIVEHYGLAEHHVGLLFAGNTILIVLAEMILLKRIESCNQWKALAIGALFAGTGLSLLPFGRTFGFALTAILIFTVGEMLLLPLAYSLASVRASSHNRGAYLAAFGIAFSSAFIIAPPVGMIIYGTYGGDVLWHFCLPMAAIAALTFLRLRHSKWNRSS